MIHNFTVNHGLKEHRLDTIQAVSKELLQILKCKKATIPVDRKTLTKTQLKKIILSSMFLKYKYDATGKFDKLKARLVANGAQ